MENSPVETRRIVTPFSSTNSEESEISGVLLGIALIIREVGPGFNVSLNKIAGDGEVTLPAGGGSEFLERLDQIIGITAARRVATAPIIPMTISALSFGALAVTLGLTGFPASTGG